MHPTFYAEVVKDPRWVDVMQVEVPVLENNNNWKIIDLSVSKQPTGSKWIYYIKYKALEELKRFNARLATKGFNKKECIDYQETFSLVVKIVTLRIVLAISTTRHWHIHQMDIINAFLQGYLEDEIYMKLP